MRTLTIPLLVLALAFSAVAQGKSPAPVSAKNSIPAWRVPELPSADMRLSWQDFVELLALIQPEASDKEKEAPPRWPWALTSVTYQADATQPGWATIAATFEIRVWDKSGASVPVLGTETAIAQARLGDATPVLKPEQGRFAVLLDAPGEYTLEVDFVVPVVVKEGDASFSFGCAMAPVAKMTVRLPADVRKVSSVSAASAQLRKTGEFYEAELVLKSTDTITVNWRQGAPAPVAKEPGEAARVACHTETLATVAEGFLALQSNLKFSVLRGNTQAFRFSLPEGTNVVGVEGKGMEWRGDALGDRIQVPVALNHTVTGDYELMVRYELPLGEGTTTVAVPDLMVEDVVRQTGQLAVAVRGNYQVEVVEDTRNLTRTDTTDLPARLQGGSAYPILHALRYSQAPYRIELQARKLEDVAVRVASIDRASLTSVLTEDGLLVTRASYTMRNTQRQFLHVTLPEGAEVWSAQVGGQPVKPARHQESGAVMLPLLRSSAAGQGERPFTVELMYTEAMPLNQWLVAWQRLSAPRVDLLANAVEWAVFVPASRRVWRDEGDFHPVRRTGPGPQVNRGEFSISTGDAVHRLREGVERFFITDINNPASSAMSQGGKDYSGARLPAGEVVAAHADLRVAGVLPISVQLPETGIAYRFERTITPADKPLNLVIRTMDTRLIQVPRIAAHAVALLLGWVLAGMVFAVFARKVLGKGRWTFVGILLALVSAAVLWAEWSLWPAISWTTTGAIAGLLHKAIQTWQHPPQSEIEV